jgi:hypothetical protein
MILEHHPLSRQLDLVFRQLREELGHLTSGTVFIQIRNNVIGKFGIRHFPLETKGAQVTKASRGLTEDQMISFRQTVTESLKFKKWTHGEILYDFTLRQNLLCTSVQFESNYNMASLLSDERY